MTPETLDLPGYESFRCVLSVEPEPQHRGRAEQHLDTMLARLKPWTTVDLGAHQIEVERSISAQEMLRLPHKQVIEVLRGAIVSQGDRVGLDSGSGVILVRIQDASGHEYVLRAAHGALKLFAEPDPLQGIETHETELPPLVLPDYQAWINRAGADPWMQGELTRLASFDTPYTSALAMGLLARLWYAEGREIPSSERPPALVASWARALDTELLEDLEDQAVELAMGCADRIESLPELPDDLLALEVQNLVHDRDELQSMRRLLRLAEKGGRLDSALEILDCVAMECRSSMMSLLPSLDQDPQADRWIAVAWQEPDAWWTALS